MSIFSNKTVLLTGGSAGIGLDLGKLFQKDGARLILVARQKDKLEEAAAQLAALGGPKPAVYACDLGDPNSAKDIFEWAKSQGHRVDILVNNAGFGMYGLFHEMDFEKCVGMIDANVRALVALTRFFVPGMVERGFGRVLNVASTAAFQPVPTETVYAATKAFVLSFSEAIAHELKCTGVGVTCLCPGPTDTDFFKRGHIRASTIMSRTMMKSPDVARIGYEALKRKKPLVIAGFTNKTTAFAVRLVPRRFTTAMAESFVKVRNAKA